MEEMLEQRDHIVWMNQEFERLGSGSFHAVYGNRDLEKALYVPLKGENIQGKKENLLIVKFNAEVLKALGPKHDITPPGENYDIVLTEIEEQPTPILVGDYDPDIQDFIQSESFCDLPKSFYRGLKCQVEAWSHQKFFQHLIEEGFFASYSWNEYGDRFYDNVMFHPEKGLVPVDLGEGHEIVGPYSREEFFRKHNLMNEYPTIENLDLDEYESLDPIENLIEKYFWF